MRNITVWEVLGATECGVFDSLLVRKGTFGKTCARDLLSVMPHFFGRGIAYYASERATRVAVRHFIYETLPFHSVLVKFRLSLIRFLRCDVKP